MDQCLGQNYKPCPELQTKATALTSKKRVKCKDCKYDGYLFCKKFPEIINKFTGVRITHGELKDNLNLIGRCRYFEKKKSFWKRLLN